MRGRLKKFAYKKLKGPGKKPEGRGKKKGDVLGYHNHNYFQNNLKINKLDQINEYWLHQSSFTEQELMKANGR